MQNALPRVGPKKKSDIHSQLFTTTINCETCKMHYLEWAQKKNDIYAQLFTTTINCNTCKMHYLEWAPKKINHTQPFCMSHMRLSRRGGDKHTLRWARKWVKWVRWVKWVKCTLDDTTMSHVTRANESWRAYVRVISHIQTRRVAHTNEPFHTYESSRCNNVLQHTATHCNTLQHIISHIWMRHDASTNTP